MTSYDIQIISPYAGENYLTINAVPITREWDSRNLEDLYQEVVEDNDKATAHYESAKIIESTYKKRTGNYSDPRLSHQFCELGDHRIDTSKDGGTHCYGWRDIRCCARCYLSHVERYFGIDCPGALATRRFYGPTHEWARREETGPETRPQDMDIVERLFTRENDNLKRPGFKNGSRSPQSIDVDDL